ncbi:PREDICTED: kinetochore-associated protein 1-like [Amphimedon queenslandica]|nr:PREDICTED: kinetochore-associated protein 1-like [Amphimedon queenslandica]|eukprot:XP_019857675.1 PREDICTED: kinetochore-associated protein 1-like [Amphimedon queenslandica]
MLRSVSDSVSSLDLISWIIGHLLPFTLTHCPQHLKSTVTWLIGRLVQFEVIENSRWPDNVLNILDSLISYLSTSRNWEESLGLQATQITLNTNHSSSLQLLIDLKSKLKDLKFVQTQLNLTLTLNQLEAESYESVVFMVLDKVVAPEVLPSLFENQVVPFLREYSLSLDIVLLHYLKHMLSHLSSLSPGSSQEAKAIAIFRSIQDDEIRVRGCVEFLQGVQGIQGGLNIWSSSVEGLVQECLQMDFPCVKDLARQYNLLKVSNVLFKYHIQDFNFLFSDTMQAWRCICYILKQDNEDVLEDSLKVSKLYGMETLKLYQFHITELSKRHQSHKINKILKSISPLGTAVSVAMVTGTSMLSKLEASSKEYTELTEEQKQDYFISDDWCVFIDTALECFKFLLIEHVQETSNGYSVELVIGLLKKMKILQVDYNEFKPVSTLLDSSHCLELLQYFIVKEEEDDADSSSESRFVRRCLRYGWLLGVTEARAYQEVMSASLMKGSIKQTTELTRVFIESCSTQSPVDTSIIKETVSIVTYVWSCLREEDALTDTNGQLLVQIMMELSSFLVNVAQNDDLLFCKLLHRLCLFLKCLWYQCNGAVTQDTVMNGKFGSMYFTEDGLSLNSKDSLPLAVDYCFSVLQYMSHRGQLRLSSLFPLDEGAGAKAILDMSCDSLLKYLTNNNHTQLALSVSCQKFEIELFVSSLSSSEASTNNDAISKVQSLIHSMKEKLTSKVLASRSVDHEYLLLLLLDLPVDVSVKKLKESKGQTLSSYTRVKKFCKMSEDYGTLIGMNNLVAASRYYCMLADWGKKLGQHEISFTRAFRGDHKEKMDVFQKMMEKDSITLEMIIQYCTDFKINVQSNLHAYVERIVTCWHDNSCYGERLKEVMCKVINTERICKEIHKLLVDEISWYDYKRIEVILDLLSLYEYNIQDFSLNLGLELLTCLGAYTRTGPLLSIEEEWWKVHNGHGDPENFPNEWRKRLPFHLIFLKRDPSLISTLFAAEVSDKDSLEKILPICNLLQINVDDVLECSVLRLASASHAHIKFNDILLIMNEMRSHCRTLDTVKALSSHLKDEDVISLLRFAVEIANKWKLTSSLQDTKKAIQYVDEMTSLLHTKETELLIVQHKPLEEEKDELVSLCDQPNQLIIELYTRLPHPAKRRVWPVHDIVSRIGDIWSINVSEIRRQLAIEWLPVCGTTNRDMDATLLSMMEDPTAAAQFGRGTDSEEEESEEESSIRKLIYLMQIELKANVQYLLRWVQNPVIAGGSASRIKGFQVLFSIASIELIEEISQSSISDIKEFIQLTVFVCELECLHINMTLDGFTALNKEGLIRTLWRNHKEEPRALRLISELCLHYKIQDTSLWSKLLERFLELHMIPYLRHLLRIMIDLPLIWQVKNIASVWYKTVIFPLLEVSVPPTEFQVKECIKSLELLQLCPFIHDLDIVSIANTYQSIGMCNESLIVARLLSDGENRNLIKDNQE